MPLFRTASIPVVGVYQSSGKFSKCASQFSDITTDDDQQIKRAINLVSKDVLRAVARFYNLSDNINDYVFPIPRAVTADVPNGNGDRFTHDELTRFSSAYKCRVFETFRNNPLHIEHMADDPKTARGFLPDVHYMTQNSNDKYVLVVAAVDTTKDKPYAEGILSGQNNSFSMGCICGQVRCSYSKCADPLANDDSELCDHLLFHKMSTVDGELIFEDCLDVAFQELSGVGVPADPDAVTQFILQHTAQKKMASKAQVSHRLINNLLSSPDRVEVARYFKSNIGRLPEAVVRLAQRLF